ncbi:electron transfer flavoprotein subunit beta [Pseudomonas sp.]|uniref:electron transfer flavoprotein subunit beta n=1 Tax=Pseudomonas sp. TaxID=306 RepID=UPI00261385FA|nr:electron transfer flavoprotein subunit beta [Pseudomonas sp.]
MKILVLLAGVADMRFALHPIRLTPDAQILEEGTARRLLSPFDEAALEVALKLRDGNPDTRIDVLLLEGPNTENLLRSVAAFCPDSLQALGIQAARLWHSRESARQIGAVIDQHFPEHELVVVGRELGDLDEGSLPTLLARSLRRRQFAMAQVAQWQGDRLLLMRERGTREEWLTVDQPLLVSVTNDKRNRLRHPLMKNVMAAKRRVFTCLPVPVAVTSGPALRALEAAPVTTRGGQCQMLGGDSAQQAQALIGWLKDQGVHL